MYKEFGTEYTTLQVYVQNLDLCIQFVMQMFKKSVVNMGIKLYNKLHNDIKNRKEPVVLRGI
jgi:hypothetical protein